MGWNKIAVKMVMTALILIPLAALAEKPGPEIYLTPLDQYSRMGRGLALRHEQELCSMALRIGEEIRSERFEVLDLSRSPLGGIGFWSNPSVLVPEPRYLAAMARVNVRLVYFPDNNWGRVGDALDAFGKDLLRILGETVEEINDNQVRGAVMVLVYSKEELGSPDYWSRAEAAVFFIPRPALKKFNSNRMTFQELFDLSDIYVFKGPEEIDILFNQFLKG